MFKYQYVRTFGLITMLLNLVLSVPLWAAPFEGQKILIAAPSPVAVEVGEEVAKMGGNVFDVAVAVSLSLAVTSPYFASLGGGGFALIKKDGEKVKALDFREIAPKKTNEKYFSNLKSGSSWDGGPAVGVPGIPAGLYELHKKYGKLKWEKLFNRPLQLASQGFPISGEWYKYTKSQKHRFNKKGTSVFVKSDGSTYNPGDTLRQPDLYQALKLFRDKKLAGFYEGAVAQDIANTVKNTGGVLSVEDMKNYQVKWREPLMTQFEGHDVYLMPPPSSGGIVIQTALKLVELTKIKKFPYMSVDEYHLLAEIMAKAFRARTLLGDPEFNKLPTNQITSEKYIQGLAKNIKGSYSKKLPILNDEMLNKESTETTHFIVMDKNGEAVSMTITLNGNYGSGVVSEKYGIALNNEMDDFEAIPGKANGYGLIHGKANWVEGGKRPLSSMSPTLVLKNNKTVMALGAPGGPRIINGVFQTLYRTLVNGFDIERAIIAPRLHHQFQPDVLFYEENRFAPLVLKQLQKRRHNLKETRGVAKVSGVRINKNGFLEGYVDFRGEGAVGGY